jgi:hypothetical protein
LQAVCAQQSPIANRQLPIVNRQLPIANRQSSIANRQLPIANRQFVGDGAKPDLLPEQNRTGDSEGEMA